MSAPTLLVLAAGIGSRYGGLKQIDPVGPNGEIILDYSVYDALRAGFGKVVFVIRRDIETLFKEAVGDKISPHIEVDYAFQELDQLPDGFHLPEGRTKPWGTAHAILAARDRIDEPFAVINADDFYGASGYRVLAEYLQRPFTQAEHALVGFKLRNTLSDHGTVARGVCKSSPEGNLASINEFLSIARNGENARDEGTGRAFTGDEFVSMNMWGFHPSFFTSLEEGFISFLEQKIDVPKSEFLIPEVVDDLINRQGVPVRVLPSTDAWFGVTYSEDKPIVVQSIQDLIDRKSYPTALWSD